MLALPFFGVNFTFTEIFRWCWRSSFFVAERVSRSVIVATFALPTIFCLRTIPLPVTTILPADGAFKRISIFRALTTCFFTTIGQFETLIRVFCVNFAPF